MSQPIPQEVEEKLAEFMERFPCRSSNCDGEGVLTVENCDGEPEQEQCEYCYRERFENRDWLRQALLSVYNRGRVAAITTVWETLRPDENRDMVIPFEQIRSKLQVLSAPSSEDNA